MATSKLISESVASSDNSLSREDSRESEDSPKEGIKPMEILASLQERLHEELKLRVSNTCAKKVHTVSYITPYSSAEDVQFWLCSKGFAARTQQKFQNVKGEELFLLSKGEMEQKLGIDEGLRLFNQIILQKNVCGFKTLRSKELSSVLEARRKKIDPDDDFSDRRDSSDSVATSID